MFFLLLRQFNVENMLIMINGIGYNLKSINMECLHWLLMMIVEHVKIDKNKVSYRKKEIVFV